MLTSYDASPGYRLGIASMLFSHVAEIIVILVLRTLLSWENRKRDRLQSGTERDLNSTAFADLTDKENVRLFFQPKPTLLVKLSTMADFD